MKNPTHPRPTGRGGVHAVRDRNGERFDVAGFHDPYTGASYLIVGDAARTHTFDLVQGRQLLYAVIVALADAMDLEGRS